MTTRREVTMPEFLRIVQTAHAATVMPSRTNIAADPPIPPRRILACEQDDRAAGLVGSGWSAMSVRVGPSFASRRRRQRGPCPAGRGRSITDRDPRRASWVCAGSERPSTGRFRD